MAEKEYIEREAAMNALKQNTTHFGERIRAVDAIQALPAADVREVVRCKDCLHFSYDDVEGGWCDEWGKEVGSPNFYCADADMREEQT